MASNAPRLYVALYTDEDVYGQVATQVRARGFDVVSTFEMENTGLSDIEQLEFAVQQERAILTHNTQDFEPIHHAYLNQGKTHFGIIVSPQSGIGEVVKRVLNMLDRVDADQMKSTFHYLSEFS